MDRTGSSPNLAAPTFPELAEVAQAAEGVALCVLLAAAEKAA